MRFVTGNITPDEYGFFNLLTTISNLAIPFVTLQINEAVYKFVLKSQNDEEKKIYFSICYFIMLISSSVIFAITYSLSCFIPIKHTFLVAAYIASYSLYGIYTKITRALNRNKVLVAGSLIKTVIFLFGEILLISKFGMGLDALLISHIFSMAFFLIYAELNVHALRYFNIKSIKLPQFKTMMRFSIPLIPNAAFWWMNDSVNHLIVSAKLGIDVNGIYAVSGKFSTVLAMVTNVLNMSWQDTAIADYGNESFKPFLTKTFNTFTKLIFSAVAVLTPFIAVISPYMIAPTYYGAIAFVPFLLLASGASAMSGFVGQIFVGKGKTQSLFYTSFFGMLTNISLVILLIESIGLWSAVIGSMISNFVLFGVRVFWARKEFAKGIDYIGISVIVLMIIISTFLYLNYSLIANLLWFVASAIIAIILNISFIKDLLSVILVPFIKKGKNNK
jgi:O-antigen/teichoic acid export membrane protein